MAMTSSPATEATGWAVRLNRLVAAEFRKIFTTNVWWALLIPVAVLTFGAGWMGATVGTISELQQRAGTPLPVGLLTVSMSTNFSTIFAALFGAMAVSAEHRNKTITTTYLTGNPRGAVLAAKLLAYVGMGVLYGVVNMVFASLGSLVGSGVSGFGDAGDWFSVIAAGLLAIVLWTLLGVGLGTLIANSVGAIIVLLVYKLVFESVLSTFLSGSNLSWINEYLPAAAGNGIVGNLSVPLFVTRLTGMFGGFGTEPPKPVFDVLHFFFGGSYQHPWWLSLLTFIGYVAVIVIAGWLVSRRRDVS